MSAYVSSPADVVLHGPCVLGFASASRIAARYGLDVSLVDELLLDYEASGLVRQSSFAGSSGWFVTDEGRVETERLLAVELDLAGARGAVTNVHAEFLPLNRRFATACTRWQIRPTRADSMAFNDHADWTWDEGVLQTLVEIDTSFRRLCTQLAELLLRFDGYADRYSSALAKVKTGQRRWVDAPDFDSCHTVWVQFHEDLVATLGIPRGSDV